jgi:hypothetical protein
MKEPAGARPPFVFGMVAAGGSAGKPVLLDKKLEKYCPTVSLKGFLYDELSICVFAMVYAVTKAFMATSMSEV